MIFIIRHGKTVLNQKNVLQGRSDCPLNEEGISQAKEAADKLCGLSFSHVYSSPLIRAVQTARILTPDVEPVIDERLIEMDYGPYEGTDLLKPPSELLYFFSDFTNHPAPEGMEALSKIVERTGAFLEEIRESDGNILIATHAIAMKGMLEYLTPDSHGGYWSKYIGNCSIYVAENKDGKIGVPTEFNGDSHH